ncbi:MAG: trans-aconitate 2-methyltransferase [Chloroflexota bacterium]|nr:trans-aconitate 2-methyltransferase [Chloroflexota bacterium]
MTADASHRWDAGSYDRVADPQVRWGAAVIDRLELNGDERVLDAGCGSGRVTEALLARLPRGSVVAVDVSDDMLAEARRRFEGEPRVELLHRDLVEPLAIEPVDAILSTATFHWIDDHDALFANLAGVLTPGGVMSAQCGGEGNLAAVMELLPGAGDDRAVTYASAADTAARLAEAGFVDVETWLQPEPTPFMDPARLREFLRTVILRMYVQQLEPDDADAFVENVAARVPNQTLDYVRLTLRARRASGT